MRIFKVATVFALTLAVDAVAQPGGTWTDGQDVEVREGDVWSPATLVRKEGRRFFVRYTDEEPVVEEWVTADRLRAVNEGDATGAPGAPTSRPAAKKKVMTSPFRKGDRVEAKSGHRYSPAEVRNTSPKGWLLIEYNDGWFEWVEPWRLREVGSQRDTIPFIMRNNIERRAFPPPDDAPGPAPSAEDRTRPGGRPDVHAAAEQDPDFKAINNDGTQTLDLLGDGTCKLAADPEPNPRALSSNAFIAMKGTTNEFFDAPRDLIVDGRSPVAVVVHQDQRPGQPNPSRVERIDLVTGKSLSIDKIPPNRKVVAVSPDGSTAIARDTAHHTDGWTIMEVWALKGEPTRTLVTVPFGEGARWPEGDVEKGMFIDPTRVLVMSTRGRIVMVDLSTATAVYETKAERGTLPALSPGGKYMALPLQGTVVIADPITGRTLGELGSDVKQVFGGSTTFARDGKRVALLAGNELRVWDVTDGRLLHAVSLHTRGETVQLCDDPAFAVVNGTYVIDLAHRVPVCQLDYQTLHLPPAGLGDKVILPMKDRARDLDVLALLTMPDKRAAEIAAQLPPPEDLLLLKPGTKVSVVTQLSAGGFNAQEVKQALTRKLEDLGVVVADKQPIQLVASVKSSSERQQFQSGVGPWAQSHSVSRQSYVHRLAIEVDKQVAWEVFGHSGGMTGVLLVERGQSVQSAANKDDQPMSQFFADAELPRHLAAPRPITKVAVTSRGLEWPL